MKLVVLLISSFLFLNDFLLFKLVILWFDLFRFVLQHHQKYSFSQQSVLILAENKCLYLLWRQQKIKNLFRNETIIDLINFVVVCQGRPSWSERAVYVEKTRQILVDFPQFNITLFDYDGTIYDLIITVKVAVPDEYSKINLIPGWIGKIIGNHFHLHDNCLLCYYAIICGTNNCFSGHCLYFFL